jgi:YfiH family protein
VSDTRGVETPVIRTGEGLRQSERQDGVSLFTFDLFADLSWLRHGVATRAGGVSAGPWATLNLGLRAGDDEAAVRENRRRLLAALDLEAAALSTGQQVHGTAIARAGAGPAHYPETDGLVTDTPGAALLVLIADCPCVAVVDPVRRAVGLGHAGWRGTVAGMAGRLAARLVAEYGSRPADLLAAVSPSIGPCCYEVGEAVIGPVQAAHPDDWPDLLPAQPSGAMHFDLWEANRRQLRAAGITEDRIEVAGLCNACHGELFYSHRRDRGRTGRYGMLAGILPG